jgi:hypothetical protein
MAGAESQRDSWTSPGAGNSEKICGKFSRVCDFDGKCFAFPMFLTGAGGVNGKPLLETSAPVLNIFASGNFMVPLERMEYYGGCL